jgi:hypothetical protein
MPLNAAVLGTESDGSPNYEYCKFCYQNGEFTHPGITLEEMRERMGKLMDKTSIPPDVLEAAMSRLPHLKRWKDAIN